MSIYAKLGGYVGLQPGTTAVYHDRAAGAAWEALTVKKRGQWVDVDFVDAQKPLRLNERTRQLETGADHDGWGGQWDLRADGKALTCAEVTLELEGYQAGAGPSGPLHLEPRGNDFVDAQGQRIVFPAVDAFLAYRQFLDGGAAALVPFVEESRAIGFRVWRVFLQGDASQNQVLTLWPWREPRWRASLRPFTETLNVNGIIPLLTFCIDNQIVKSDLAALWTAAHAELTGLAYLASWGNELNKNGGDPNACPNPGPGVCWSRGSRTQDEFYPPNGATAAEFHPVRNLEEGRTQMDAVASVFFMRKNGCGMLWLDESFPFDNDTPPQYAYDLGRLYATYWSVACFHNRQSQRGLLMGPGTRACAEAWVKGMAL